MEDICAVPSKNRLMFLFGNDFSTPIKARMQDKHSNFQDADAYVPGLLATRYQGTEPCSTASLI
jgi:hypothetical protein